MAYRYGGTATRELTDEEAEFRAARARLAAATEEAYPNKRNGHNIVTISPAGHGIDADSAAKIAYMVRILPLVKDRAELLTKLGYNDNSIRRLLCRHGLTKLYRAYAALPIQGDQQPYLLVNGRRMNKDTIDRFARVEKLINHSQLSPLQIAKATGYRDMVALVRQLQRHGRQDLLDRLNGKEMSRRIEPEYRPVRDRLEDMDHLLTNDTRATKEELLARLGWHDEESFTRAARRVGRPDIVARYRRHGQR